MDNDRIVEIGAQAVDPNAWVVTREDRVTWLSNIPDERILASKHSRRQKARWSTRRVLTAFEEAGLVVVPVEPSHALKVAGRDAIIGDPDEEEPLDATTMDARNCYCAMIAAAKADPQ